MYLLAEMVVGVSDWLPWLQAFRNESLIPLLVQTIDDRLKVRGHQYDVRLIYTMCLFLVTIVANRGITY